MKKQYEKAVPPKYETRKDKKEDKGHERKEKSR
jgi:hypothetical protein